MKKIKNYLQDLKRVTLNHSEVVGTGIIVGFLLGLLF